jgi:sirohydrochlorin ferrochelatase
MTTRNALLVLALALATPEQARDSQGILILAPNGPSEWNAQVKDLAAKVGAERLVEVVLDTPSRETIGSAVDRLAKRGAIEVLAVRFFLSTPVPEEQLTAHAVPVRLLPPIDDDPALAEMLLKHAAEISQNPGEEVLVLAGYGSGESGNSWVINLTPLARRLNQARRFASILSIASPNTMTEKDIRQMRLVLDRQIAYGRRVLVVPLVMGKTPDPHLAEMLQGLSYESAKAGLMSDQNLVRWLATR